MSDHDERQNVVRRAINWLRAGYPNGVPREDYVTLIGMLHHNLTEDEVASIAAELAEHAADGEKLTESDVRELIEAHAHQEATPEDVARVSSRLAAGGWPLAKA